MHDIDLSSYAYYPCLRTRRHELPGLSNLNDEDKKAIIPILTQTRWYKAVNLQESMKESVSAMNGNPFFADLAHDDAISDEILKLRNPSDGFSNWRHFLKGFDSAIPIVQFNESATQRDTSKQARFCENEFGKLAFRIRDFQKDIQPTVSALSALDDTDNAIVFIDVQYIRNSYPASKIAVISSINEIRKEIPETYICILAASYPRSFTDNSGTLTMMEHDLHAEIGDTKTAFYGDYGPIHPLPSDSKYGRYAARIDYPNYFEWLYERRSQSQFAPREGYIDAAKAMLERIPDIKDEPFWGSRMIVDAADGNPCGAAPKSWIPVRINLHLAKQIELATAVTKVDDED